MDTRWRTGTLDTALVVRAGTCAALVGAAVVHATVVGDHFEEWPPAGLFFLALLVVEALLAAGVVVAWGRRVALLVLASSLGTLGVWALSRTAGLPVGPPGLRAREPVGVPDLACVVLEVAAALLVTPWVLSRRQRATPADRRISSVLAAGAAVLVAAAVTGWGVAPAVSGDEGHHDHTHGSAEGNVLTRG
jgi:hypothetical protein